MKFEISFKDTETDTWFDDEIEVNDYSNINRIKDQIEVIAKDMKRRVNYVRYDIDKKLRFASLEEIKEGLRNEDRNMDEFFDLIKELHWEQQEELNDDEFVCAVKKLNGLTNDNIASRDNKIHRTI